MRAADHLAGQPHAASYGSLEGFYAEDPRRRSSREQDVGLWWRAGSDGPLHRAAWVWETGELYLMRLGPVEQGGGRVELLARVEDHDQLERVLEGWREQCGRPSSLGWLREQVGRLGASASRRIAPRVAQGRPRGAARLAPPFSL